jgi:glycosyltransferase involved in cell wall biosynthesis
LTAIPAGTAEFRIASVQHGDYLSARRRFATGGAETYGSQRYSVNALEALLAGHRHLVLSLDGPASDETEGNGRYVCLSPPRTWLPARLRAELRARTVIRTVAKFRPTHLLVRTNDIVGCALLSWANRHRVQTAAVIAARFDAAHKPARRFCRLANHENVLFVGNHNQVATRSLIDAGLHADKAIAWDYPARSSPTDLQPKVAPTTGRLEVLFAGNLIVDKGPLDLLEAVGRVRRSGIDMGMTVLGGGPLLEQLRKHAGVQEDWLKVHGLVPTEQVALLMRSSWLIAVPTRPAFPEALPLVLIDALATRTPVLLSDHPVFRQYFVPGQAVEFFRAADPQSLAAVLQSLAADPLRYARLSEETAHVWQGLQIEQTLDGLFDRFARATGLTGSASR